MICEAGVDWVVGTRLIGISCCSYSLVEPFSHVFDQ